MNEKDQLARVITKVDALKSRLKDLGGVATWEQIYQNIERYYTPAKSAHDWKAALRGVLYRELYSNRNFKKIGLGLFALVEYEDTPAPPIQEPQRWHSYVEGVCLEIGNYFHYLTYTPDRSAKFKGNVQLRELASVADIPEFTYPEVIRVVRKIDVTWLNKEGYSFPQRAFEIVHTPSTLAEALNRCLQLIHFNTSFTIVGSKEQRQVFNTRLKHEPYVRFVDRFDYKDYTTVIDMYEKSVRLDEVKRDFFKRD